MENQINQQEIRNNNNNNNHTEEVAPEEISSIVEEVIKEVITPLPETAAVMANSNSNNNIRRQSSQASINKSEWVKLNVGGQYFLTTKTTLCKNPQSFFYKLCQDDPSIGLTTDKVLKFNLIYYFC